MTKTLDTSMAYLHWHHIVLSVILVFLETRREAEEGAQQILGDADCWAWNSRKLSEFYERVIAVWCSQTGKDETWWPYSKDCVARLFLRVRKRRDDEIQGWLATIRGQRQSPGLFDE